MTMSENRKSSYSQPGWKRISIYGFVLGAVVVLIGLVAWFFMTGDAFFTTFPYGRKGRGSSGSAPGNSAR